MGPRHRPQSPSTSVEGTLMRLRSKRNALVVCVAIAAAGLRVAAAGEPPLRNPGFEAGLDGWSRHVYGAQSTIEADTQVFHEGKQSLRISAAEPSDTALGQEVRLRPGRCYRLRGWVRTRGLDPHGAP